MSPVLKKIHLRVALYKKIRDFFAARNVLEVETPLLCQHTVTDPHIESFQVTIANHNKPYYLQTSPEYAMKRLLCETSCDIYQITKSFRQGECGHQHNPEFSMLEWYRVGFDHHTLMQEVDALLQFTLNTKPAEKISYQQLFLTHLTIDPFTVDLRTLKKLIIEKNVHVDTNDMDHDTLLQILLTHLIEPKLGVEKPLFLFDFPPTQAALAKIRQGIIDTAERFELYINGVELANGFHELSDVLEQKKRFEKNQVVREKRKQCVPDIDHYFISALEKGLPDCAGVAMGLDRLLMQLEKTHLISEVLLFPFGVA